MRDLTPRAQANVESGADSGAGTLVCRRCHEAKPESRINSDTCGCERKVEGEERKPAPFVNVTVSMPRAVYDTLRFKADAEDRAIASVAAEVLADWSHRNPTTLTPEQWSHLVSWWKRDTRMYDGPLDMTRARNRMLAYQWALAEGYDPNK